MGGHRVGDIFIGQLFQSGCFARVVQTENQNAGLCSVNWCAMIRQRQQGRARHRLTSLSERFNRRKRVNNPMSMRGGVVQVLQSTKRKDASISSRRLLEQHTVKQKLRAVRLNIARAAEDLATHSFIIADDGKELQCRCRDGR